MKEKSKKVFLAAVSVALIGVMGVAGTFAYLQDTSDNVVNTFQTNKVKVELTETDKNGEVTTGRDDYNIIPGTSETKDPKVTVNATIPAYVYLEVTDTANVDGKTRINYTVNPSIWTPLGDAYPNIYYCEVEGSNQAQEIEVLVNNTVSYPASLTNDDMPDAETPVKLSFQASAIQKAPFGFDADGNARKDGAKTAYLASITGVEGNNYFKADADTLEDVLEEVNDGDVIVLSGDVQLKSPLTIDEDVTIVGDGSTVISKGTITMKADAEFKNIVFEHPENANSNATMIYGQDGMEKFVFDGCTFSNPQWEVVQITSKDFKSLVINNCTFNANDVKAVANSNYGSTANQAIRYIHVQPKASDNVVADITITNNIFNDIEKVKDSIVGIYFVSGRITVGDNTFNGWGEGDVNEDNETSGKLSVGWPEVEDLKTISRWKGEAVTYELPASSN